MPSETGNLVLGGIWFILIQHMFNRFERHKVSSGSYRNIRYGMVRRLGQAGYVLLFIAVWKGGEILKFPILLTILNFYMFKLIKI
ncbi:hypothetical protein [Neisseria cinerea]|uniref:hypothetical protein n=1 Tax=Neisseria cinerea TaxID=483 RepID=UPI000D39718A|nr:hypothetical protein [Neisseria cinerea]